MRIAIQDRIFLHGPHADPYYRARREGTVLIPLARRQNPPFCGCRAIAGSRRARQGLAHLILGSASMALFRRTIGGAQQMRDRLKAARTLTFRPASTVVERHRCGVIIE
jgi:hypothetical protein